VFAVNSKKAMWQAWTWGDKKPCYRGSLPEKMTAMTFSSDATLCFGGAASGSIYIWQVGTGHLLRFWPAHFREVTKLEVSEDGSFLISASADANVNVYILADVFTEKAPKPFHSWSGHSLAVTSLALIPGRGSHQLVASGSLDRSVRLWDIGSGKALSQRSMAAPVHSISTGPSGSQILCACANGELQMFSPLSGVGEAEAVLTGHTGPVLSCDVNVDGTMAASCSEVDRVRIWELRTRQCVSQVHTSRNVQVNSVQIIQRSLHSPALPAFQPFQRLLSSQDDTAMVPLCRSDRPPPLEDTLDDFIENALWSEVSATSGLTGTKELEARCAEAEADAVKWRKAASELYCAFVDAGLDKVP